MECENCCGEFAWGDQITFEVAPRVTNQATQKCVGVLYVGMLG